MLKSLDYFFNFFGKVILASISELQFSFIKKKNSHKCCINFSLIIIIIIIIIIIMKI